MRSLEEQLKQSASLLEQSELSFALAGGLAAGVYRNDDRVTKDVDFIVNGKGDLVKAGRMLLVQLGLKPHIARQADFDGGPLFAIKKGNSPEMAILGRDPEKKDPGVDLLLPNNKWVPRALERAQFNLLDFGFGTIPTMTVEDVVVAKLIASHKSEREQDTLDLRSIFRAKHEFDLVYIIARMKEFHVKLPKSLQNTAPADLRRASKRIARERLKK